MFGIRNCFVCQGEVEVTGSRFGPAKARQAQEHFFLLSHILELPDLENYLHRVQSTQDQTHIPYCSVCTFRINKIRNLLEQLEEFEKELKQEKSKIEAEFKRNFRTTGGFSSSGQNRSPEIDDLRNDIATDLRSDSILLTLDKLKNGQVGQRFQPRRSIRIHTNRNTNGVTTYNYNSDSEGEDEGQEVTSAENLKHEQGSIVSDLLPEQDVKVEETGDIDLAMTETEIDIDPLAGIFTPHEEILPGDGDGLRDSESEALHHQPSSSIKISNVQSIRKPQRYVFQVANSKCSHCGKKFTSTEYLRAHIKYVHLKLFEFKCQICNKGCRKQSELTNHMQSHSRKKNYKCRICEVKFKFKGSIYKHFRTFHPGESWHPMPVGKKEIDY